MIFQERSRQLGPSRALLGSFALYFSFPFLVLLYLFCCRLMVNVVARRVWGLNVPSTDEVLFFGLVDSRELSVVDHLNCSYCTFANGISLHLLLFLAAINRSDSPPRLWQRVAGWIALPFYRLAILAFTAHGAILYRKFVFPLIGHAPTAFPAIATTARQHQTSIAPRAGYFRGFFEKDFCFVVALSGGLKAVETYWCPLKRKSSRKVPPHHEQFVEPSRDEIMATIGGGQPLPPFRQ